MNKRNVNNMLCRPQQGVGLVEVMVAIAVGLFLLAGVMQVYVNNKQTYRVQDALARLQENGRFALNIITQDLRNAGFLGCAGGKTRLNNVLNSASGFTWNFSIPAQGFEATSTTAWSPSLDTSISGASPSPLGGRDVITVRHSTGNSIAVTAAQSTSTPPGSSSISVPVGNGLNQNDIVMISDCTDSAIFKITNATPSTAGSVAHDAGSGSPGNASAALGKDYPRSAEVVSVVTTSYYIATDPATTQPALWGKDALAAPQEIVEGVQDLQVRYGLDTDQDNVPNRYVTADNVTWSSDSVVSIRVDLLLATTNDNLADTPQPYTFNGTTYDGGSGAGHGSLPTDKRLRRSFSETIGFRNKTL